MILAMSGPFPSAMLWGGTQVGIPTRSHKVPVQVATCSGFWAYIGGPFPSRKRALGKFKAEIAAKFC
jgi:hypothetical protein